MSSERVSPTAEYQQRAPARKPAPRWLAAQIRSIVWRLLDPLVQRIADRAVEAVQEPIDARACAVLHEVHVRTQAIDEKLRSDSNLASEIIALNLTRIKRDLLWGALAWNAAAPREHARPPHGRLAVYEEIERLELNLVRLESALRRCAREFPNIFAALIREADNATGPR